MGASTAIDRLAMRVRPQGAPVMEQNWEDLLFLHWSVDERLLRPLIPPSLELDTFEDKAWVGITPFRLTGLRLPGLPAIPGLSAFNELNLRTYVHHQGTPGIWFFSLDASKLVPAVAARLFFGAPYYPADIKFNETGGMFDFNMQRTLQAETRFRARWRVGARLRAPALESLAFFLVERYCFFAEVAGKLTMTRIYHHPWILDEAEVLSWESTLLGAQGVAEAVGEPLTHFSQMLNVQVWPPVEV